MVERICAYKYCYCSYTVLLLYSSFGLVIGFGLWSLVVVLEGVVAPRCNPLTLQLEQSGGADSIPGRTPPLKCHDKGSRTRLGLLYFCDPSAWRSKTHFALLGFSAVTSLKFLEI